MKRPVKIRMTRNVSQKTAVTHTTGLPSSPKDTPYPRSLLTALCALCFWRPTPAGLLGGRPLCYWFACQWREPAVPGNSFPWEALCPWRWVPTFLTPLQGEVEAALLATLPVIRSLLVSESASEKHDPRQQRFNSNKGSLTFMGCLLWARCSTLSHWTRDYYLHFPSRKGRHWVPKCTSVHLKTQAHLEMDVSGSPFAVLSPGVKTDLCKSRDSLGKQNRLGAVWGAWTGSPSPTVNEAKPKSGRVGVEVSTSVNAIRRGNAGGPVPGVAAEDIPARWWKPGSSCRSYIWVFVNQILV